MRDAIKKHMCDHPHAAGETYFQHLVFTVGFGFSMLLTGLAIIIHGIFPFLFVCTATKRIERMNSILQERKKKVEAHQSSCTHQ